MGYSSVQPDQYPGPPESALLKDSTVQDHDPTLHPETFFHIPGDGNWTDDLGNVVLGENPNAVSSFADGVAEGSIASFFNDQGTESWDYAAAGQFTYSPPTSFGIGDFTAAHLIRIPPNVFFGTNRYTMTIKNSSTGGNYGISLGTGNPTPNARLVYGPSTDIISGGNIDDEAWHHLCATISGTEGVNDWTVKFFVDGVQISSTLTNRSHISTNKADIRLHLGTFAGTASFRARAQVRSFIGIRKALSDAEVAALSTATIGSP